MLNKKWDKINSQYDNCQEALDEDDTSTLSSLSCILGENLINILRLADGANSGRTFFELKNTAISYASKGILTKDYSFVLEQAYKEHKSFSYIDCDDSTSSLDDLEEMFEEIGSLMDEVKTHLTNKGLI